MGATYEQAINFYKRNYQSLCVYRLSDDSKKIILEDSVCRRCRFCGRQYPEVSFKLLAHALPEMLGNKKLFSSYECDTCNAFFGLSIENDYGNWSKPLRMLTGQKGKKGVPTLKGGGSTGWRIERENNHFYINAGEEEQNRPFVISEDHRVIDLALKPDPYRPMAVHKAFVKMALSILPEMGLPNFYQALAWIMNPDHREDIPILAPSLMTITPGPIQIEGIKVRVICRKEGASDVTPYAFLLLSYGDVGFQVILPSPERDAVLEGKRLVLPPFPHQPLQYSSLQVVPLDFLGTEPTTDLMARFTLEFEAAQSIDLT